MVKKAVVFVSCSVLLFVMFVFFAVAQESSSSGEDTSIQTSDSEGLDLEQEVETSDRALDSEESIDNKNLAAEFDVDPGITPDNPLYFFDDFAEKLTVGDNPEKALKYKEEKIAEAREMVEEGKPKEAKEVLDKALSYNDKLEREVNPEMRRKVMESTEKVQAVLDELKDKASGDEWEGVKEKFDEVKKKEKDVETAVQLASKIKELCDTLAKLDPLQYTDSCKAKSDSPRWIKNYDEELTAEQEKKARIFYEKLSQCFENPRECDCNGMGVQKFEDFCIEKSKLAEKCKEQEDEKACKELESGSDPADLLPSYLVPILKKVENKYSNSQFELYAPEECVKRGIDSADECKRLMFKLNAPEECVDTGLTGESKEDEYKCRVIMFEKNSPQECLNAGIKSSDPEAPRKCAKIMFQQNAPKECINAGITGEGRDDQKKCRELMNRESSASEEKSFGPSFNKDCNKLIGISEKVKCYEEFYNNAQLQFNDDFREREFSKERNTREFAKSMGAANPDKPCPDNVCDKFEQEHADACPEDCGGTRSGGRCQTPTQVDNLKKECREKREEAIVENRGGCPWVVCVSREKRESSYFEGGISTGQKCPDRICDDYEKMNPWACPEDCGGQRQEYYREPENRIDQPQEEQQPSQQQFCSGQAPSCAPNGAPYCQDGRWVCSSQPQQEQQPMQEPQQIIEQEPQLSPEIQPSEPESQIVQEPSQPIEEQPVTNEPSSSTSEPVSTTTPVTGGVISEDNSYNGQVFWNYWYE